MLKIEDPKGGDYMRWIPPYVKNESAFFMSVNRNKKSMKLNLKHNRGKEIFKKLAATADVLVESFRPGVMEKLGAGYPVLKDINPRLVYCAITGYGQNGPYKDKAGHDLNYISFAGVLGLTGKKGGPPVMPAVQVGDIGGGALMAAAGILTALMARDKTGKGQFVDISMTDGALAWLSHLLAPALVSGAVPRVGEDTLSGGIPSYQIYETKDGKYMSLAALEPKFWQAFCDTVQRPDLLPEGLVTGERRDKIVDELQRVFKTKTRSEWMDVFAGKDVCCEPVYSPDEVLQDPHHTARKMFVDVEHPTEGIVRQIGMPIKLSETPGQVILPPPKFGEHTEEVLKSIGYSQEEITALQKEGVI